MVHTSMVLADTGGTLGQVSPSAQYFGSDAPNEWELGGGHTNELLVNLSRRLHIHLSNSLPLLDDLEVVVLMRHQNLVGV